MSVRTPLSRLLPLGSLALVRSGSLAVHRLALGEAIGGTDGVVTLKQALERAVSGDPGLQEIQARADAAAARTCHHRIIVGSGRAAVQHPEFRWVNTILGNLKTAITGTYHAFAFAKYATRYLAEVQYRFNRRFDLRAVLGRLAHARDGYRPLARADHQAGCSSSLIRRTYALVNGYSIRHESIE